ncbi:MAG: lytic transglycosylase domain-containing protein [Candidatus Acidiferrales bacterium]
MSIKLSNMRYAVLILGLIGLAATSARADYAVLRTGERLHITGYERDGDSLRLTIDGGSIEVLASDVVSFEPEDVFRAIPVPAGSSAAFANLIRAAAQKHGVDEKLIASIIAAESNFNPRAASRKNARGLMQLLPSTAARYSVANILDPAQNIDAGTRYLKELLQQYHGDLKLTLAAYNAGPDVVAKYGGVPPFPETRAYVRRVTSKYAKASATGVSVAKTGSPGLP